MNVPTLGVGITYTPELDPLLELNPQIVDVLEIEPQIFWHYSTSKGSYIIDENSIKTIGAFNYPKIFHSVSSPIGGASGPDHLQILTLLKMISHLRPYWLSEHLAFNRIRYQGFDFNTGFLLPPLQTPPGINAAAESIKAMSKHMPIPFGIENGVNYLKPRQNELSDGEFIAEVIKNTKCGLVLDLHNAYTNALNGRQPLKDFLDTIPLEYVWELHLAGGTEYNNYWLDSHGNTIPKPTLEVAYSLLPKLRNLRAIVFEIEPSYLSIVGAEVIYSELRALHKLWESKGSSVRTNLNQSSSKKRINRITNAKVAGDLSLSEWEYTLGSLAIGFDIDNALANELKADPGINILRKLNASNRSSMIVRTLKLTSRLLMLTLGTKLFENLLAEHWKKHTPEIFATAESENFAKHVEQRCFNVPYLYDILNLEKSILDVRINGGTKKVHFQYDPRPILRNLIERKLPKYNLSQKNFEIEVNPHKIVLLKEGLLEESINI